MIFLNIIGVFFLAIYFILAQIGKILCEVIYTIFLIPIIIFSDILGKIRK